MAPADQTGREHGSAVIEWVGEVLLCVSDGNFNLEGALFAAELIKQQIDQRPSPRWAVMNVNLSGNLSVPEVDKPFNALAIYGGQRGAGHSALINCSVVQDQVVEHYYRGSGVTVRSFRRADEAVAWLRGCGYRLSDDQLARYLPPH